MTICKTNLNLTAPKCYSSHVALEILQGLLGLVTLFFVLF